MHSKCRWEIEDVGGRGLKFSRPTERELDFLTARLSRGKKGEGGFFRAYIRSTEQERLFEGKTHECISHTSPGVTFSERDGKCTQLRKREMQFANALSLLLLLLFYPRARVIPNFSFSPSRNPGNCVSSRKGKKREVFLEPFFAGKEGSAATQNLGLFFPQEIRASDNP